MTNPISPGSSAYHPQGQSSAEAQRLFDIQFETAVLGIFVDVTGHGGLKHQISRLKEGMSSGKPTAELGSDLNQLITQINATIIPGKASFPTFLFSSEGNQVQAITHTTVTLQKCLNVLSEKGAMPWAVENKLFGELSALTGSIPLVSLEEAYGKINQVIKEANAHLPSHYQIPELT